jgi:hypothetical protein
VAAACSRLFLNCRDEKSHMVWQKNQKYTRKGVVMFSEQAHRAQENVGKRNQVF